MTHSVLNDTYSRQQMCDASSHHLRMTAEWMHMKFFPGKLHYSGSAASAQIRLSTISENSTRDAREKNRSLCGVPFTGHVWSCVLQPGRRCTHVHTHMHECTRTHTQHTPMYDWSHMLNVYLRAISLKVGQRMTRLSTQANTNVSRPVGRSGGRPVGRSGSRRRTYMSLCERHADRDHPVVRLR